jgi:hypothetical protein
MLQDYFERINALFDSYIKENWGKKEGGGLEVSTFSISLKSIIENQVRDFMLLGSSDLSLRFQINFLHPFLARLAKGHMSFCHHLASVVVVHQS